MISYEEQNYFLQAPLKLGEHQTWRDGSLQTNDLPDVPSNKGVVQVVRSQTGERWQPPSIERIKKKNYQRSTSEPQK
jgi:hypothetical protein